MRWVYGGWILLQISKFGSKNHLNRFRFRVKFNLIDLRILLKWQTTDFPNNSTQIVEWFSFPYKNLRTDTVRIQPETDYHGNNSMRQDETFVLSHCLMRTRHLYIAVQQSLVYRREYLLNKRYKARLINQFVSLKRDIFHALIEYKQDLNEKEAW